MRCESCGLSGLHFEAIYGRRAQHVLCLECMDFVKEAIDDAVDARKESLADAAAEAADVGTE